MKPILSFPLIILLFLHLPIHAENRKFSGFWKDNCSDAYGVQIKPYDGRLYAISFCGPGGCLKSGEWMPNTTIVNDPNYRIITDNLIEIYRGGNTWDMYQKCTNSTIPAINHTMMNSEQPDPDIMIFKPNKGLPDYIKNTPFVESKASSHAELKKIITSTRISPTECDAGLVPVPDYSPYLLKTNICRSSDYKSIKRIISELAPSLDEKKFTFQIQDYNMDGERELLIEYIDLSNDKHFKYPYLSLWMLEYTNKKYRTSYAGPFLSGEIHSIKPFGNQKNKQMVFIKHFSCIECKPWIYLTVIDFSEAPAGKLFKFTYEKEHQEFDSTIEYKLPGFGHSIDATVDSRIPAIADEKGPHLIQNFEIKGNGTKWWIFTCNGYQCNFTMYLDELPQQYTNVWENADRL